MQSPTSPLDRMRKLSIFRSKSDQSSPTNKRRISDILLSPRSRQSDVGTTASSTSPGDEPPETSLPLNPRTSVERNGSGDDDLSELPALPLNVLSSDGDDPLERTADDRHNITKMDSSGIDEQDMARQLMDVESSFVPDQSPHVRPRLTTTGTAIFSPQEATRLHTRRLLSESHEHSISLGDQYRGPSEPFVQGGTGPGFQSFQNPSQPQAKPFANVQYSPPSETPASRDDVLSSQEDIPKHSTLKHTLSSPSAAAAQRSKLRTAASTQASSSTNNATEPLPIPQKSKARNSVKSMERQMISTLDGEASPTFAAAETEQSSSAPHHSSTESVKALEVGSSNVPISAPKPHQRSAVQPPTLEDHHASRQSSASSFHSARASGDSADTAEPGLSGHETPMSRSTVRPSHELSRLPSFGSIASSISGPDGSTSGNTLKRDSSGTFVRTSQNNLERLAEEEKARSMSPETPLAKPPTSIVPTDTILAQHVRDIQVPNTVAKAYRETNPPATAKKYEQSSSPNYGKGKNNLTLKEQNSRIDKLSKENFDLKLKIHYLHQALQDRSDEGVSETISKNAQLQTDLIKAKKDNQILRKRVRELERQQSGRNTTASAPSSYLEESEGDASSTSYKYAQMEEELIHLRNQVQSFDEENQKLRGDALTRETEKRRLADQVRRLAMPERSGGSMTGSQQGNLEALLDYEAERREQAEREIEILAEEIGQLKNLQFSAQERGSRGDMHSTSSASGQRPRLMQPSQSADATNYSGSTLLEQLRIENADLRRDLGAQTSMLTSRNRERERLQQEIENLKLLGRGADGVKSSESLLERSISRANQRPSSRHSSGYPADREQYETTLATLRDESASLKLKSQDLSKQLETAHKTIRELESELADADVKADEDRAEAQELIDQLEDLVGEKQREVAQIEEDLQARDADANNLQHQIQTIRDSLNRVAEDSETQQTEKLDLQRRLTDANGEMEAMETNIREVTSARDRLEVQSESMHAEISFLREEQESDKIKIGDLQSALRIAKNSDRDNQARLKELEDLEDELSQTRQEIRQLKKALAAKDLDATNTRDKVDEIETGLRRVLGDDSSSLSGMLKEVIRLQRDLENALQDLDNTKEACNEQARLLKDRENLLEASGLETRRLGDMLEKERQARKHDQNEYERSKRNLTHPSDMDTALISERKKLARFESKYNDAIRVRDSVLLDAVTRLSSLCGQSWKAKNGIPDSATLETIATSIPSVNTTISAALATLESYLPDVQSRVRGTERRLLRDYSALQKSLTDRSTRLEELEKALGTNQRSFDSVPGDNVELARLKDENRHLKRELKFLKQGSFALPGLPSPQEDLERIAPRDFEPPTFGYTNSDGSSVRNQRHANGGSSGRDHNRKRTAHQSDLKRQLSGGNQDEDSVARDVKDSDAAPNEPDPQHLALQHNGDILATASGSNGTAGHAARHVHAPLTAGEHTMMLKLQGLQRQLTAEREGRILDRKGARTRLREGEGERERLKAELAHEKAKSKARADGQDGNGDDPKREGEAYNV